MSEVEAQFKPEEIEESCRVDLDFLALLCMPDTIDLLFPDVHKGIWGMLTSAAAKEVDFEKFALGLPRGHAKTLVIKLYIIWCILFSERKFILIVGATLDLAENIIADIVDILDSDNFRASFGFWRSDLVVDRQNFKKFKFRGRPIILKAAGAGTAIRGIAVKNARPDIIICDDAQTKECAESVTESAKFVKWFLGTLSKAKNPKCCTYVYIGNMYPDLEITPAVGPKKALYTCLLRNLQVNPAWTSFIVGAILADGKALWPELHPLHVLLSELEQDLSMGQEAIFYAEVLNDPNAIASRLLDPTKLVERWPVEGDMHYGSFIVIDPSAGKKNSDDVAIGYCEVYDGKPYLRELKSGKFSPLQTIHEALSLCAKYRCSCIAVESVAYQSTLCFWMNQVMEQRGITSVTVVEIGPKGRSKVARIINMFKQWMSQEIGAFNGAHALVLDQAVKFNPLKKDNVDDILDIMAYMQDVVADYPEYLVLEGDWTVVDAEFTSLPSCDEFTQNSLYG